MIFESDEEELESEHEPGGAAVGPEEGSVEKDDEQARVDEQEHYNGDSEAVAVLQGRRIEQKHDDPRSEVPQLEQRRRCE